MEDKPVPLLFQLQTLVSDFSKVERNHHVLGSERSENDVEHSYTIAMLCWYIYEHNGLELNLEKILQYALVHDLVEVYAGDVNTFAGEKARSQKHTDEQLALKKLSAEFEQFPSLIASISAYEERADEESLFVWSVDKIQQFLLGDLDDWRPYKKINIKYEDFATKHNEQLALCSPHCRVIFESVLEYCKTTFYDRPA